MANDNDFQSSESPKPVGRAEGTGSQHTLVIAGLAVGLVVALGGDIYLTKQSRDMQQDVAKVEAASQTQISKLSEATTARMDEQQKEWDDAVAQKVKTVNDNATAALRRARTDADKRSAELSQQIEDAHSQLASSNSELAALKDTTNSKFTEVASDADQTKANLETVKSSMATAQTQLDSTTADLKRVVGDMGVMSGLIATNGKDLETLRALGERNYYEFDINKKDASKKVGDLMLTLKKTDPKRSRFTLDVLADDRHLEKKDKTINEPVQLYVSGNMQPYEIVINQVTKDHVTGYLATPKVKMARR
jgi:uncharacterized phage infection (PIP) family protein YhgE